MKKMTRQQKQALVDKVEYWWHTIDLGDGVVTPGFTRLEVHHLRSSAIPKDLKGKTVLDIGAWDGYYSFECERRGAKVIAIDKFQHGKGSQGFETAKKILNSKVRHYKMDLYDLPKIKRKFDVVLFFGVFYHLKYPLKALEIIFSKTNQLLILESHYIKTKVQFPVMRFYPKNELANDFTNWYGPNIQCLKEMLKTTGFKKVRVFKTYLNTPDKGRVIIKAYK